jgi:beta-lactamase superfamily II metal-dependent hydrolase
MFDGLELDMLSLGDADCTIITKWQDNHPHRILIDGGCGSDSKTIIDFLLSRGYLEFWAAICSHAHNDHASGLAAVIRYPRIKIHNGWMHDIRKHVNADSLRRAATADAAVNEVVETTKELAGAFASRGIPAREPFTGHGIAKWPDMQVLGPSSAFYELIIGEVTKQPTAPTIALAPSWRGAASILGGASPEYFRALAALEITGAPRYDGFAALSPKMSLPGNGALLGPLAGALSKSSVSEKPKTQPFNETSVILGIRHGQHKLMLTADAGSRALSFVSPYWNHLDYCSVPHHGSEGNFSQQDIERFCPKFAFISAKGDSCHPDRAVVSALVKVGAKVASTHKSGNLGYFIPSVPYRSDYGDVEYLTGTGSPQPIPVPMSRLMTANYRL